MLIFIANHLIEIIFGLISAGALAFCKYLHGQMKNYKTLLEKEEDTELDETIDIHLKPLKDRIEELSKQLEALQEEEKEHMDSIVMSYRFRLIQLCKQYIAQGYITQEQYDQLTEMYKVYHSFGGNGQAQRYYETAMELEIRA